MTNDPNTSLGHDGASFNDKVDDFNSPTQLPTSEEQAKQWQQSNKDWWERTPMRYDWKEDIVEDAGTVEYYAQIDARFYDAVKHYMPWKETPFDNLIDFASLAKKDVLEVGVGHGSHANLIAPHCKSFTGIDLTDSAVLMTKKRLELSGIDAEIFQSDAEKLEFSNESFDFVWSWGVIHHSANTEKILAEISRVLKSGGQATVMVYHRSFWKYWIMDGLFKGLLFGQIFNKKSLHKVSQSQTDGAIARYYTIREWQEICSKYFAKNNIVITGQKLDMIPLPAGKLKDIAIRFIPNSVTRFCTNKLKMGSFLIATLSN